MHGARLGLATLAALLATPAMANSTIPDWQAYTDNEYGFSVDLPMGLFAPLPGADSQGLTLTETGGEGQISLYGGAAEGLTLSQFAERLSAGEQIRTITYQTGGDSWFVLSGYFDAQGDAEPLVFYTKVLMSADHTRFSAFEISYPEAEKTRFDPIVDRIEDSMTRPRL